MDELHVLTAVIEAAEREFSRLTAMLDEGGIDYYYGPGREEWTKFPYYVSKALALMRFLDRHSRVLESERDSLTRMQDSLAVPGLYHPCPACRRWYPEDWLSDAYYTNRSGLTGRLCLKCEKLTSFTLEDLAEETDADTEEE